MIASSLTFLKNIVSKSPTRQQTLNNLLHQNTLLYPCYGGGLSNHISMALVSLYLMNSSSIHLQKYFESKIDDMEYRVQPDYFEKQNQITEENVQDFINYSGKDNYDLFFSFFWEMKEKKGMEYTINFAFEKLGQNCGAQLMHAIIRIQFGIAIENDEEIIAGLCFMPVKAVHMFETKHKEKISFDEALQNFQSIQSQVKELDMGFNFPGIFANDLFQNTYRDINLTEKDIPKITESLIRAFIKTINYEQKTVGISFIILHMVTSFYALKITLQKTSKFITPLAKETLISGFFKQLFAVYWLIKCQNLDATTLSKDFTLKNSQDPDLKYLGGNNYSSHPDLLKWDEILRRASKSIEDHTIKFIFVCHEEAKTYPELDGLFRFSATRRLIAEP